MSASTIFVFLFVILSTVSAVRFTNCGTTVQDLDVEISTCGPSDDFCPFVIGTNVTMTASFKVIDQVDSAVIKLYGKLGPVQVPFSLKPEQACGNWGMTCPIAAGQQAQLVISLPIQSSWKPVKVGVKFELWNDKTKLICTQFPAKLVNN